MRKFAKNMMLLGLLVGLSSCCYKTVKTVNTKLFCADLKMIEVEGFDAEKFTYDTSVDIMDAVERNNNVIYAYCIYEN